MKPIEFHVLTLFPSFFEAFLGHSMIKKAIEKKIIDVSVHDLRKWTRDKHKTCDDRPFGGGPGMLMKPEPIFEAYDELFASTPKAERKKDFSFIYLSPRGKRFDQKMARSLSKKKTLVFLCGHYEGVDERVVKKLATQEISIGDFVITGGELASMVVMDAVSRLRPGMLGHESSAKEESFSDGLLEYPQYTRPSDYRGMKVPEVLLSGDHEKIRQWRHQQALLVTKKRRPDMIKKNGTKKNL